jgi:hypothetical protein
MIAGSSSNHWGKVLKLVSPTHLSSNMCVLFCQWCVFYCTVFNLHAAFEGQWANSCLDCCLCKQVMKLLSNMLLWMVLVRDCHCWSYCRYVYFLLLLLKVFVRDCHCCSFCRCVFSIFLFLVLCFLCSFFWVLEVLIWRPFSHLKGEVITLLWFSLKWAWRFLDSHVNDYL